MSAVTDAYKKLEQCRLLAKEKGDAGEEILLNLAYDFQEKNECILLWSYSYPYQMKRDRELLPGNIKLQDGKFIELTKEGYNDEIDLVIITPYRLFVIECKARGGKWDIYDHWANQNYKAVDKSPITQCEKHCRHLYQLIYEYLPDCNEDYIVPLTAFVDRATITEKRAKKYRNYMPVCIANNFKKTLKELNKPLEYQIDSKRLLERLLQEGEARGVYK